MFKHVIFFDRQCPLCCRAVEHILEIDKKAVFAFAPLNGDTADAILVGPLATYRKANSLVLVEHYQSTQREFWIRSKAILRMYWLIGDGWGIIGWLSFLPSWLGDFFYKWVANHRHQFKLEPLKEMRCPDRFLP